MAWNILLTSLSAAENDPPLRYFSMQKEFGFDYCDALLDTEAGIKAVLARHRIDEIIVIGGTGSLDEKDELDSVSIRQGSSLYSEDRASFSTYRLLRYRIAQYADELNSDQKAEEELLPGLKPFTLRKETTMIYPQEQCLLCTSTLTMIRLYRQIMILPLLTRIPHTT